MFAKFDVEKISVTVCQGLWKEQRRIKGTGLFWKREHAENIIFLRSLVLTGKLKNACRKGLGIVRNMFDNNTLENLPLAA